MICPNCGSTRSVMLHDKSFACEPCTLHKCFNPTKPMSHAERGRLGGQAKGATKGFGTPAVSAKAVAKLKAQAEERKAKVQAITDRWQSSSRPATEIMDQVIQLPGDDPAPAVEPVADPAEDLQPYISKPFRSALDVPAEITVIE